MASMLRNLLVVAMAAAISELAMAANHDVGGPNGSWDLTTNYAQWAAGKTFRVGDTLTFKYASGQHDVLEVSSSAYSSCSASNPISTGTGGSIVITLKTAGKKYFICGIPGHCASGMKVAIDVVASSSSPAPRRSPAAAPSTSPISPAAPAPGSASVAPAPEFSFSTPSFRTSTELAPAPNTAAKKVAVGFGLGSMMMMVLLAL
ncbi:hypothetical protein Cni_G05159 [Canna indica]|uniref:Phytocyanin domain-containing protein n=1 Tax=Canna indica TaxID=4628 RepID=A0AAQ3JWP3_9LILI|nr:hypothetical protein Cni_G05159 [Canna indica]